MENKEDSKALSAFERLSRILDILRVECPWDKVQTIDSLRYLTIEETYELSESILEKNPSEMRKELGDLFMHLLFYAKIAEDENLFSTSEVLHGICDKLVSRHPHIALPNREGEMVGGKEPIPEWEKVKMKEGRKSVLEGVPASLPTLVKSIRMQEKAAGMGFEFPTADMAFEKVKEEYEELNEAFVEGNQEHIEEEFGDLLFALIKWGRFKGINADDALGRTNQKFQQRFTFVEQSARDRGCSVSDLTLQEMHELWRHGRAKKPMNSKNIK
ncbi:MAG: nucleoside triphosphate pyrophosphohydrolase [Bacteroidales bacterium]|nr:nucleoside triphosphate pyrophosphohydrolase [Candidatus Colimorpha merdihippi]